MYGFQPWAGGRCNQSEGVKMPPLGPRCPCAMPFPAPGPCRPVCGALTAHQTATRCRPVFAYGPMSENPSLDEKGPEALYPRLYRMSLFANICSSYAVASRLFLSLDWLTLHQDIILQIRIPLVGHYRHRIFRQFPLLHSAFSFLVSFNGTLISRLARI